MFSANTGVLFFGAEGQKTISWDAVSKLPEMVMDETNRAEEQSKVFATMKNRQTVSFNCHVSKKDIKQLMDIFNPRPFKLSKGPIRKHMIRRAKKMQTNYIYTYTFRKEGDEYVDERGQVRLILQ